MNENKDKLKICSIKENNFFGEISFFAQKEKNFNAETVSFTTLISIHFDEFMEILHNFKNDWVSNFILIVIYIFIFKESFHQIREKINTYDNHSDLYLKCFLCKEKGHYFSHCPQIIFKKSNALVVKKILKNQRQQLKRQIFLRTKRRPKICTLGNLKTTKIKTIDFQARFCKDIELFLEEVYGNSEYEAYSDRVDSFIISKQKDSTSFYESANSIAIGTV